MGTTAKKPPPPPSLPLPPAQSLGRARSRASRVADLGDTGVAAWPSGPPDTPPRRSPVTVPFLWEEAPGKPKASPQPSDGGTGAPAAPAGPVVPSDVGAATSTTTTTPATGAGDRDNGGGDAKAPRPAPLKLPPRLQRVASAKQRDGSLSPRTVLHGPHYYGCTGGGRRPPRRTASGFAAFRRTPSAGVGLFSRSKTTSSAAAAGTKRNKGGGGGGHDHLSTAAPDAPWGSPAASSASSSSSSSLSASCFGDDHGHGGHRRAADGREDGSSEEDECAGGSVRITRFRRNRSLPTMTTSHLWSKPINRGKGVSVSRVRDEGEV
ncbi:translation initiation factor IF-2-like [Panicum miliaceum]|uniref:Translation initiation factor IF-2-like n=1 Tax=Panicum miliaceum TaxID=4540 RepID=A0A3L6R198_PANMI|nr:translation initiation factor IF-2-like [Panicum miliaceum]